MNCKISVDYVEWRVIDQLVRGWRANFFFLPLIVAYRRVLSMIDHRSAQSEVARFDFSWKISFPSFLLTFCFSRLRDEKMKSHTNLEVQLLLKQGQVSILRSQKTSLRLTISSQSLCCILGGGDSWFLYHRLCRQCSDSPLCCRRP